MIEVNYKELNMRNENINRYLNALIAVAYPEVNNFRLRDNLQELHFLATDDFHEEYPRPPYFEIIDADCGYKWRIITSNRYYIYLGDEAEFKHEQERLNKVVKETDIDIRVKNEVEAYSIFLHYAKEWVVSIIKHFDLETNELFPDNISRVEPINPNGAFNLNISILETSPELRKALKKAQEVQRTLESSNNKEHVKASLDNCCTNLCELLTAHFNNNVPDLLKKFGKIKRDTPKNARFKDDIIERLCRLNAFN